MEDSLLDFGWIYVNWYQRLEKLIKIYKQSLNNSIYSALEKLNG